METPPTYQICAELARPAAVPACGGSRRQARYGMSKSFDLRAAAHQAMLDNGFIADVPAAIEPNGAVAAGVFDLRDLPWSSIDNNNSRDLDQLEIAEKLPDGTVRVRVAIADVDTTVPKDSATDHFASANSTSVYTGII